MPNKKIISDAFTKIISICRKIGIKKHYSFTRGEVEKEIYIFDYWDNKYPHTNLFKLKSAKEVKLSKFINIEEPHLDTNWDRGRGNLHTFGGTDNGNPVPQFKDEVIRERELVEVEPHIFNTIFKNAIELHNEYKNYRKLYEIFVDLYEISKKKNIFNGRLNKLKQSQQERERETEYHCGYCECYDNDYYEAGGIDHEEIIKNDFDNEESIRYEEQQIDDLNIILKDLDKKEKELLKNLMVEVDTYGWRGNKFKWMLKS